MKIEGETVKVSNVKGVELPESHVGYIPEEQKPLFDAMVDEYLHADGPMTNAELYECLERRGTLREDTQIRFGRSASLRSKRQHQARWIQQTLKNMNLLERVGRGEWQVTKHKRIELTKINADNHVLALSTDLGLMVWSRQENLLDNLCIDEPIELVFTSTIYPIAKPRAYGGITEHEVVDFITNMLEPIVERMVPGGNIALNLGLTREQGSPAESIYIERLVIALHDRLGLKKMKTIIWKSNKNPVSSGPYATREKQTLINCYEPVLWFCRDPDKCFVDTRTIAEEHTEAHKKFVARGGVKQDREYGDRAYKLRKGDYGTLRQGRLPKDVWDISNYCYQGRLVNEFARECQLPVHSAKMPNAVARRVVELLSRAGGLVFDPCCGTGAIPEECESLGRKWIACEQMLEYVQQSFVRFMGRNTYINPRLKSHFLLS